MKIEVSKIHPNPFRNLDHYQIDRTKVDKLKASISDTGFWDNLLVRPFGDEYQLAYGHHRLQAIKEVGLEYVDIPVRNLDDATMLKIMANENMDEWRMSTTVINETVEAVRKFIADEVGDCRKWDDLPDSVKWLFDGQVNLTQAWGNAGQVFHVGHVLIHKFLGNTWAERPIKAALQILNASEDAPEGKPKVSRQAAETFTTPFHASAFTKAVKDYNEHSPANLDEEDQQEIVNEIVAEAKEDEGARLSAKYIRDKVAEKAVAKTRDRSEEVQRNAAPIIKNAAWVGITQSLGNIRYETNRLDPIWKAPEERKAEYARRVQEVIDILTEKMEDAING